VPVNSRDVADLGFQRRVSDINKRCRCKSQPIRIVRRVAVHGLDVTGVRVESYYRATERFPSAVAISWSFELTVAATSSPLRTRAKCSPDVLHGRDATTARVDRCTRLLSPRFHEPGWPVRVKGASGHVRRYLTHPSSASMWQPLPRKPVTMFPRLIRYYS